MSKSFTEEEKALVTALFPKQPDVTPNDVDLFQKMFSEPLSKKSRLEFLREIQHQSNIAHIKPDERVILE